MTRLLPQISDDELSRPVTDDEPGFGGLRTSRGLLPLAGMEVTGRIDGLLAQVEVMQTFVNACDEPLEATYIFPLPDRAAVRGFRMQVAGRTVEGVLQEREQARLGFDRAISAGQRAAIAEEERPNVFTLRVGNLMPGEQATVHLELAGPLPYSAGEVTFRFPLVVAPRYIPGIPLSGASVGTGTSVDTDAVPDASRITPPVLLPGFPSPVRLAITVDLYRHSGVVRAESVRSSLHAVLAEQSDDFLRIRLEPGERLDRDFILRFHLGSSDRAGAVSSTLSLHPDLTGDGRAGTFALTLIPPAGAAAVGRPRDVVFVLDRSGSMEGWKIVAARRAMSRMIDSMAESDRFGVLAFDDALETPPGLPAQLAPATDRNRFQAIEYLARVSASGGTEIARALHHAAAMLHSASDDRSRTPPAESSGRQTIIVLVTDGQVGNEDQVLRTLAPVLGPTRVFALGIDKAVNEAFLRRLAELGRGAFDVVESEYRLDEVMASIHRQIAAPLLTNLIIAPDGFTIERDSLVPGRLPDVFDGSPALILGRYQGHPVGRLTLRATDSDGRPWTDSLPASFRENPAMAAVWARGQVRTLEDRYAIGHENLAELERQIVAVSLRFGVLCRFTAFVAIDRDEVANTTSVLNRVTQAVEMPAEWAPLTLSCSAGRPLGPVCAAMDLKDYDDAVVLRASSRFLSKRAASRGTFASLGRAILGGLSRSLGAKDEAPAPPPPPSAFDWTAKEPDLRATAAPSSPNDLPDQYRIQRQIAMGGMGQVFEAFDQARGRIVVGEVRPARFVRDGHKPPLSAILTTIAHPSLQAILEIVERGDQLLVIMDSLGPGKLLHEVLRNGALQPEVAARLVADIAEGVQFLLDHGVLQWDIKPARIFLTAQDRAVLTDVASHVVRIDESSLSRIMGTPAYMAPELIAPGDGRPAVRSSVYSLGATLYELLTGVPPYSGRTASEVFARALKGAPRPPRRMRRAIPTTLESICLKAMARRPEDRHATPGELAAELRRFLSAQPERRKSFWKRS
jgi:Ca-activated chloride channel family protein